jgi:hypothetical protein
MRDEDLDRLLRADTGEGPSAQVPLMPSRRRPVLIAGLVICAAALALVAVPVVIALSGDALEMFLGIAVGDPGLVF